jgi:hypothetical protein
VCVAFPRQKPQVLLFHKSEPQVPRARGPDDATQRHSRSERNAAHQRVAISISSSALRVAQSSLGGLRRIKFLLKGGGGAPNSPGQTADACTAPQPAAPRGQPIGSPDERTANVRHRRKPRSSALIDRIREPGAGLCIRIRSADVARPALAG